MIVVDANVIAYFFIEGKKTELARQLRIRDSHWVAPDMWRHEFLNILVSNCLFAKMPLNTACRIWTDAEEMMKGNEYASDMVGVLSLALEKSMTAYDTEYALLARSLGVTCVTEDDALRNKFPDTAVSMSDFLAVNDSTDLVREKRAVYGAHRRNKRKQ